MLTSPPSDNDRLCLLCTAFTTLLSVLASVVFFSAFRRSRRRRLLLQRLSGGNDDGKSSRSLPLAPGSSGWLLGHVPSLLSADFHSLMCRWADELGEEKKSKGAFLVALPFGDRGVVVTSPLALSAVLRGGRKTPSASQSPLPKYLPAYGVLDSLWGGAPSVFTCSRRTERWATVRKRALAPAFSVAAAKGSVPTIASAAEELCLSIEREGEARSRSIPTAAEEKRRKGDKRDDDPSLVVVSASPSSPLSIVVNADALGMRLALSSVGRSVLGSEFDFGAADASRRCAPVAALAVALPELQASMTNPLRLFSRDERAQRASRAKEEFRRAVLGATKKLREKRREGEALPRAASALLSCCPPRPSLSSPFRPDDAALAAEVGTLIMGGFETTGHVLAFALLRLAACPRARRKVEEELASAGLMPAPSTANAASPRLPSSSDLRRLPFALAVAKEALRLHPTVPGFPRTTAEDDFLLPLDTGGDDDGGGKGDETASPSSPSSVLIPAGTFVYALLRHAQRDESQWGEDALEFRPERWEETEEDEGVEEEEESKSRERKKGSFYAPFSLGPRDCAGKTLALVTLHVAIAVVVSRFELAAVPESYEGPVDDEKKDDSSSTPIDVPEEIALTAHPARPLLRLIPRRS